jgi:hypothetical protein
MAVAAVKTEMAGAAVDGNGENCRSAWRRLATFLDRKETRIREMR